MVYKYLTEDRIDVLENCMIRYTQPGAMNDPFEFRIDFSDLGDEKVIDEIVTKDLSHIFNNLTSTQKYAHDKEELKSKVISSLKSDFSSRYIKKRFDEFDNLLGILSLCASNNNPIMWAHYANEFKGFVIGFYKSHKYFNLPLSSKDEFKKLKKVIYEDVSSKNFLDLEGLDVFYRKDNNWKYEEEYRIIRALVHSSKVVGNDEKGYSINLYKFPANLISSIILGHNMKKNKILEIQRLLKKNKEFSHIKLFVTKINKVESKIDIIPFHM